MKQLSEKKPEACESCGGELTRISPYEYQCTSCGRKYYVSASRLHKVSVRLSMGQMILLGVMAASLVGAVAVVGYEYYTGRMVQSASRFSVVFRDFLMEVYDKPIADIKEEDLNRMKYLKIERSKGYRFTYSFEDYYDYPTSERFEKTCETIAIDASKEDFSPTNVQYFTGLTRLELYTDAWENYVLPEENVIRGIYCMDGLSRYGTPQFFDRVNPDTLEEVAIMDAGGLEDYSFMENLRGVKRILLEKAVLKDVDMFEGFDELEQIILYYVELEEEDTYSQVKKLLSLPSMEALFITGKTGWYITDEEWEQLLKEYGDRVVLYRE